MFMRFNPSYAPHAWFHISTGIRVCTLVLSALSHGRGVLSVSHACLVTVRQNYLWS